MALRKNLGKTSLASSPFKVPFFKPFITGKEWTYIQQAIQSSHWSGDGPFTQKCSQLLKGLTGHEVVLTSSGTSALELSLMALNFKPGDEVILPSYTFVSTANAIVQMGLTPIFIDIRKDTLNIDEKLIESALSEKTRAILAVHYAGISCEMDTINLIAKKYHLAVVEDAAQGVNAFYKGKALGSLGDLGVYSFHQTKNYSCGEGGALIVSNLDYLSAVKIHRQKGTDRSLFLDGKVAKYTWVDRGSNYLLSDLLAAFLLSQLQSLHEIQGKRKRLYLRYEDQLSLGHPCGLRLPIIPKECQSNYHIFYILLNDRKTRDGLMAYLKTKSIQAATHFEPLHLSRGGAKYGITRGSLKTTENVWGRLLRLPFYTQMTDQEQNQVIEAIHSFLGKQGGNIH